MVKGFLNSSGSSLNDRRNTLTSIDTKETARTCS